MSPVRSLHHPGRPGRPYAQISLVSLWDDDTAVAFPKLHWERIRRASVGRMGAIGPHGPQPVAEPSHAVGLPPPPA